MTLALETNSARSSLEIALLAVFVWSDKIMSSMAPANIAQIKYRFREIHFLTGGDQQRSIKDFVLCAFYCRISIQHLAHLGVHLGKDALQRLWNFGANNQDFL